MIVRCSSNHKFEFQYSPGQSGGPIIRKSVKQATGIGPLGKDLDSLLKAFIGQLPVVQDYQGIKLVQHVASPGFPAGPRLWSPHTSSNSNWTGHQSSAGSRTAESFFSDLGNAGKWVGGTFAKGLLQQPFFKNAKAGAPLSAGAGAALNYLVNPAEPASSNPAAVTRKAAERVALAEVALQTVLKLDPESAATMKGRYSRI
ncbi:hypothetical protein QBC42DRAFT_286293 [Cladorrhinum samala]|uniref:Uncharacterized protein n=1 Tax=Cladorrhinum samala TaxID=585594 RepID=A0AAV9HRL6_9PEZI|nr:hypothetical protein QBC42DRAFT_286293 [Cladorrhinum samala]